MFSPKQLDLFLVIASTISILGLRLSSAPADMPSLRFDAASRDDAPGLRHDSRRRRPPCYDFRRAAFVAASSSAARYAAGDGYRLFSASGQYHLSRHFTREVARKRAAATSTIRHGAATAA